MTDNLKIFKALADETRLRIYRILTNHELNVNEIVEVMVMGQSRVSRHLKILTESTLLSCRRDGSFVYYQAEQDEEKRSLMGFIKKSNYQKDEVLKDLQRAEIIVSERKKKTRAFFNNVAATWDDLKQDLFGDFDLNQILTDELNAYNRNFKAIVDLGCGTGELLSLMNTQVQKCIGVDSSPKMLELAKERFSNIRGGYEFRLGELEHLPVKEKEVDFAVINMVLHHIAVPSQVIYEAGRVLAPDGFLMIADLAKHTSKSIKERFGGSWMGFEKEEIEKWLTDAGFKVDSVDTYKVRLNLSVNVFKSIKLVN
ncbi:MAG: metalloregulator ArsR/SmtB family transcription factor [Desulfobacteraceae bacterium]|nr:metalloregulator ArsR/SmtB family transcription factor [Desulfobacteraceae bacterium]